MLAYSRKNLAFEGLDTHSSQDDESSLELDVDDEPIIMDVKAWAFTVSSLILTCFSNIALLLLAMLGASC